MTYAGGTHLVQALEEEAMPEPPMDLRPLRPARLSLGQISPPYGMRRLDPRKRSHTFAQTAPAGAHGRHPAQRIALARREQLDYASFLEIKPSTAATSRLQGAGFQEICRLEDFDWSVSITMDRRLLDAAFSLEFLARHEHVWLVRPEGVFKSFLAQALGLRRQGGAHRPLQPASQDHGPSQSGQFAGAHFPVLSDTRPAHPRRPGPAPEAVRRSLRAHTPPAPGVQLRSAYVDEWLGLFDLTPSWERPGPAGQCQLPASSRAAPPVAAPCPAGRRQGRR